MEGPNTEHQARLAAGDPLALEIEARAHWSAVLAERSRFRREMLAVFEEVESDGDYRVAGQVDMTRLRAALDRICPAEEEADIEARLSRLDALLASEEPPEELGRAMGEADHAARIRELEKALRVAYDIAHDAWNSDRFGPDNADEAKELRREMAGVLGSVGLPSPIDGRCYGEMLSERAYQRAADAALVGAAGCICWDLYPAGGGEWTATKELVGHDPRCPVALAAAIEARKEG